MISKDKKPFNFKLLIALVLSCGLAYTVYKILIGYYPQITMIAYMAIATVLIFWYVIYNRGFSRKGITADMLPQSWDDDKKTEFLESAERRLKGSKPLLVAIIAFIFTFFMEIMELMVIPFFLGIFGG